jgi:uncharacterized membrane protein
MEIKRILLPDLLKGLAAVLMVQVHITELFIDNIGRESMWGKTSLFLGGPFAAMVFMIVMGYFVARNKKSPKENLFRGIKIFALGFLLNVGLNFHLLWKIIFEDWPYNLWQYVFGVDILYLAGISIMVLSALKQLKKGQEWASISLFLLIIGLSGFMNNILLVSETNYFLPFLAGNYSWSYFPVFPWLAYPVLGFFLSLEMERIKSFFLDQRIYSFIVVAVTAVSVLFFGEMGINTSINLPDYYHHTYGFAFWALGLVFLWAILLFFVSTRFAETKTILFLCWVGKNITVFYVIQWLIIGNISTVIYQTKSMDNFVYYFFGIFAVTVMLTFLYEKAKSKLTSNKRTSIQNA